MWKPINLTLKGWGMFDKIRLWFSTQEPDQAVASGVVGPMPQAYFYCDISRVIDGDSFVAVIDRWDGDFSTRRCRVRGVDARELKEAFGADDKTLTIEWVTDGLRLMKEKTNGGEGFAFGLRYYRREKYGRWEVELIRLADGRMLSVDLNGAIEKRNSGRS